MSSTLLLPHAHSFVKGPAVINTHTHIKEHHRSYLGRFRERKHRAKNDVEPRVHWTLNTTHQFIIIATSMIS
jgi:hypothetical protein